VRRGLFCGNSTLSSFCCAATLPRRDREPSLRVTPGVLLKFSLSFNCLRHSQPPLGKRIWHILVFLFRRDAKYPALNINERQYIYYCKWCSTCFYIANDHWFLHHALSCEKISMYMYIPEQRFVLHKWAQTIKDILSEPMSYNLLGGSISANYFKSLWSFMMLMTVLLFCHSGRNGTAAETLYTKNLEWMKWRNHIERRALERKHFRRITGFELSRPGTH
jgi:hypothetical protein